jgi:hypothetical protein
MDVVEREVSSGVGPGHVVARFGERAWVVVSVGERGE